MCPRLAAEGEALKCVFYGIGNLAYQIPINVRAGFPVCVCYFAEALPSRARTMMKRST
jgi:hypothetical protein